jgi:hypothetical protein
MTQPDEALLWARDAAARPWGETDPEYCRQVQAGDWDDEPVVKWRATAYRAGAAASDARIKALEKALRNVSVSLIAAISLLEGGGKKAAASDKMFAIMLSDYQASVSRARALLKEAGQ